MELFEMQERAAELEQQISALPAGSITKKTVNGKEYFYHRWTENKKRREKYISADELADFRAQIERRKALEQELKALKRQLPQAPLLSPSRRTLNNYAIFYAKPSRKTLNKFGKPSTTLIILIFTMIFFPEVIPLNFLLLKKLYIRISIYNKFS